MTPAPRRSCKWCGRSTATWVLDASGDVACADQCRGEDRYRRWRDIVPDMLAAIERHGGNLSAAGREFGTDRSNFRRRVMKYLPGNLMALAEQRLANRRRCA